MDDSRENLMKIADDLNEKSVTELSVERKKKEEFHPEMTLDEQTRNGILSSNIYKHTNTEDLTMSNH